MFGWSFQFVRPIHCSWMGKYWYSNSGQYHPHRWWFKIKKNSTEAHSAWSFIPLSATAGWKTYIRSRCEARRISEASTAVNMTYTRFFPDRTAHIPPVEQKTNWQNSSQSRTRKFMTISQSSLLALVQGSKTLLLDMFCSSFQLVGNRIAITTKTNSHTK